MKLSLATFSLTTLLALTYFCQTACGQIWTAKLFSESSHDFGDVLTNQQVEHRFKVVNHYDFPISIGRVRKSAGPFTAVATKDSVAPSETAEIVCKISSLQGMHGIRRATVTVPLIGKERGEYQMLLRANVVAIPKFDRSKIEFPDVQLGQESTVDFKLSVPKATNNRLVDIRSTFANVRIQVVSAKDTGDSVEYDLKIRLLETTPKGAFDSRLYFIFQSRDESQESKLLNPLVLPITGNVVLAQETGNK